MRQLLFIAVPRALHFQGVKDVFAEKVEELLTAHLFHNQAGDDEVGIRVLPLGAGFEVERPGRPGIENLARRDRLQLRGYRIVLRRVILVPRGVRQNLPDRYFAAARQAGNIFAHRVIQAELALFLQQQDCRRRELLRDRPDRIAHVGRGCLVGIKLRVAVGMRVHQHSTLHDGNRRGRDAPLLHHVLRNSVDTVAQRWVDSV